MVKKIKVGYFPKSAILTAPICIVLATYFFYFDHLLPAIVLCSCGIIVSTLAMTTFYITEFDLKISFYKDYMVILGVGFNHKKKAFRKIEKLIITRGRHEHTARFPGAEPRVVNWHEYTATLLHDHDELELMTKKDKRKLIKEIKDLANFLKVNVEDRSVRDPYLIDLRKI